MKKLLLIALMAFGAPASAQLTNMDYCLGTVSDLNRLNQADAPSIVYEYFAKQLSWMSPFYLKDKDEAKNLADLFITKYWLKLGEMHEEIEKGERRFILYSALPELLCDKGTAIQLFGKR